MRSAKIVVLCENFSCGNYFEITSLGADPNYADSDKGNTALHNAAREGQTLQVELLAIYGADVAQRNAAEQTPANVARLEKHVELGERLDELEFEVTDRFSMFLCGRMAEHKQNQHFLIPELVGQTSENVKQYRKLLQNSSSVVLERLIQDVYDEVDRREINAQWVAAEQFRMGSHQHVAVFLPPNQKLSATRNQLRQKRRYFCLPLPPSEEDNKLAEITLALNQSLDLAASNLDDSRDYDEVADGLFRKSRASSSTKRSSANRESGDHNGHVSPAMGLDSYLELKEKLIETNEKLNSITETNAQILKGFQAMQKIVEQLQTEQFDIRNELKNLANDPHNISMQNPVRRIASPLTLMSPASASEIGAVIMPTSTLLASKSNTDTFPPKPHRSGRFTQRQSSVTSPPSTASYLDAAPVVSEVPSNRLRMGGESDMLRIGSAPPQSGDGSSSTSSEFQQQQSSSTGIKALFNDGVFPDNLILETELLTGAIKSLLADLQQSGSNDSNAVFHSDSIGHHITRILRVIPPMHMVGIVQVCANEMEAAMSALSKKCLAIPLHSEETCHAAYDVAKAAKQLLVTVHSRTEFN
uniref:ARF GTPase-activating protein GIT2 n=1 Tax=Ditylenchus dipsaci TaxID=166011 RepID=A0A915E3Z4_9BILA